MRTSLPVFYSICTFLCLPSRAFSDTGEIPKNCATPRESRAYQAGLLSGASLVKQAWASIDDCDRIEEFDAILMDDVSRLTLPLNPSLYTVCRYAGTIDGVYNQLDELYGVCVDMCFFDGRMAGAMSGKAYCDISIALGGLSTADDFIRGPVQLCGFNFELGCDSRFVSYTANYKNSHEVACVTYTIDPFVAVWQQARYNQCAYNPIPPEEKEHSDQP